jgi:DNA-binding NarL/FixJ family response regulator
VVDYAPENRKVSAFDPFVEHPQESRIGHAIRVMVVDDQPVFREGLCTIISSQPDMTVVSQSASAVEALIQFRAQAPDVTTVSNTTAMIAIHEAFPMARVAIVATLSGDLIIQRALNAGAMAYVLKSTPKDEILKIIRCVARGRKYIPSDVASVLAESLTREDLTHREIEVLTLLGQGSGNKQIAHRLSIAETTVRFHIKNLVEKLGAANRIHAFAIAMGRGLFEF